MKFCPKCGTEIKTVESRDKSKIEQVTEMASSGVMQAGSALTEGVEKSREKFNEIQNMSKEERKERATKQLTRDVLVELIEKIYVFPKQELDIHFKFVNPLLEAEEEAK